MPITAKLSKAFYDRFGETVVTELIDLLNLVDATYRDELREANERNFDRFRETLERRIAETSSLLERRIAETNARIDVTNSRMDQGFLGVNARIDALEVALRGEIASILPSVNAAIARESRRMMAWFLATLIALIGPMMILASRR